MATLRPLGDKILIKRVEAETKTKSGIVLPDSRQGEAQARQGPGRRHRQAAWTNGTTGPDHRSRPATRSCSPATPATEIKLDGEKRS